MAEIEDERELRNEVLLGLIRIQVGLKPPAHMSVDEALGQFDRMGEREHRQRFYAAADYFVEMLKLALANRLPNDPGSITIPRVEYKALKAIEHRSKWRPIVEIHEDCGECVCINLLKDPTYTKVMSCLHPDFSESDWSHFVPVPRLTTDEAERLIDAARKEQGNG